MSDVEVIEFVNMLRVSAGEAMRLCRTTASDDTAKAACANTVKDTLASTLGKDASSIEAFEVNDFLRKATRKKVGDKMKACSESASDDELLRSPLARSR